MDIASELLAKTVFSTKVQRLLSEILGAVDETSDADDPLPETEHTQRIETRLDRAFASTWRPMPHTTLLTNLLCTPFSQTKRQL